VAGWNLIEWGMIGENEKNLEVDGCSFSSALSPLLPPGCDAENTESILILTAFHIKYATLSRQE